MPEAGRVIAGTARGIRLAAPGPATRPLADRVKETLFAILEPELRGARFLDLFAGSGAAGIEALSRGARAAVFVDKDATACRVIEENLRRSRLDGGSVARADVLRWLAGSAPAAGPFDIVVADPPYADTDVLRRTLDLLGEAGHALLAPGARVVAKHFWREVPPAQVGLLASERERRFGETALTFYRAGTTDTRHRPGTDEEDE
jgi:16S rRNA (guanine(966)-N(2))-methyltransferase RsmD